MNPNNTIFITLDGAGPLELERCRKMIHRMFELGFFATRSGSFTANFDVDGTLASVEKVSRWRADKPDLHTAHLAELYKGATIEITPSPLTMSGATTKPTHGKTPQH